MSTAENPTLFIEWHSKFGIQNVEGRWMFVWFEKITFDKIGYAPDASLNLGFKDEWILVGQKSPAKE